MTSSDTQAGNRLIHRLLLGRNFWIGPTALLFLAQLCVVKLLGERNSGAVATNIVQICVQILGICVFLRTARASHSLARYFWLLAVFSSLVFSIGLALAISAQFLALSPNVPSWADAIFVFFFGPVSLTLFLEPDFEHRRFDRIHILDFTQVLLFCIAVYLFWQYSTRIFPAASSGHDWFRESWVGIFLWDGVLAGTFLLRAVLADSRLVRALFGRIGCYLVFNCLADLLYDRYFQNLSTGSWYEIIWTAIAIIPIAIAGAWNDAKFEERSSSAQRGNRINASNDGRVIV